MNTRIHQKLDREIKKDRILSNVFGITAVIILLILSVLEMIFNIKIIGL